MINRILIIGYGSIAKKHIRLLRELMPSAHIALLRHSQVSDIPVHVDTLLNSMDDAKKFRPELTVVCNPSSMHIPAAIQMAENGSSLFIEKPLSSNVVGCDKLIQIIKRNKLVSRVGYNLRYSPSLRFFKDLVAEHCFGRPLMVSCEVGHTLKKWRDGVNYANTVSASRELGGGVLLELSHELDYLHWIFGKFSWVSSNLATQSDMLLDVEDTASLLLEFRDISAPKKLLARLSLDFIRHNKTRYCEVIMERGSLRWDGIAGTVESFSEGEGSWQIIFDYGPDLDGTYLAQWHDFLEAYGRRDVNTDSIEDGLYIVSAVMAAQISSENNCIKTLINES